MNTERMGNDYLRNAEWHLKEARSAFQDEIYSVCVRRSQECIEFSLKGLLRIVGVEFPREHDVSKALLEVDWEKIGIPEWFTENIHRLIDIMKEITPKRGFAMYGDEERMIPASDLFGKKDGEDALKKAEFVFNLCKRMFLESSKNKQEAG